MCANKGKWLAFLKHNTQQKISIGKEGATKGTVTHKVPQRELTKAKTWTTKVQVPKVLCVVVRGNNKQQLLTRARLLIVFTPLFPLFKLRRPRFHGLPCPPTIQQLIAPIPCGAQYPHFRVTPRTSPGPVAGRTTCARKSQTKIRLRFARVSPPLESFFRVIFPFLATADKVPPIWAVIHQHPTSYETSSLALSSFQKLHQASQIIMPWHTSPSTWKNQPTPRHLMIIGDAKPLVLGKGQTVITRPPIS
jgi:hypothetical protein